MWQEFCHSTHTDSAIRHDIWKFCGGGKFADERYDPRENATVKRFWIPL